MTIKEFAHRLGLSTATVSRAFTPGARIHPDTRAHILEQARALGYAPNPNARNLAQRRNRLIGLDFPANADVLSDLYLVELARGIQTAAQRADYGLLFNTLPRPGGDTELLREWVFGRAVDGVVIVVPPDFPLEALCPLAGRDVPCVLITLGRPQVDTRMPVVAIDLAEGTRAVMTHLRRLGHERIGFLTSGANDAAHAMYCEVLAEDRLLDPKLIVQAVPIIAERRAATHHRLWAAPTIAEGRAAMHRLLAAPIRPTAVFCRTDIMALGALRAARDMNLRVPEDLSIIGHDDIVLAELSDPALTTVRIDTARIGHLAVELLLEAFAAAEDSAAPAEPRLVTVGTELIVRSSTARNPLTSTEERTS
jgi:DNA-binding LacI/PurR family transcriptional regulator